MNYSLKGAIGIFDSGYGGLTILNRMRKLMPNQDFIYLGDNARTPYGTRSFEVVYKYTLQAVERLFDMGCPLVVLACNTASAKALRTIQQIDLPRLDDSRRVLGVIRPTVETIGQFTKSRHIGILATDGTVQSRSYPIEIFKLYPDMRVTSEACNMWVPLIESREHTEAGADYFVQKNLNNLLAKDPDIDLLVLGCTHYPLLIDKIRKFVPDHISILSQGEYVAASLESYLARHPEMSERCTQGGSMKFYTTESADKFAKAASLFMDMDTIEAKHISIEIF